MSSELSLEDQFLEKQKKILLEKLDLIARAKNDRPEDGPFFSDKDEICIRFALHRIEERQYGLCPNCGLPIGREFLEAVPEIPFCSDCKSERVPSH